MQTFPLFRPGVRSSRRRPGPVPALQNGPDASKGKARDRSAVAVDPVSPGLRPAATVPGVRTDLRNDAHTGEAAFAASRSAAPRHAGASDTLSVMPKRRAP